MAVQRFVVVKLVAGNIVSVFHELPFVLPLVVAMFRLIIFLAGLPPKISLAGMSFTTTARAAAIL